MRLRPETISRGLILLAFSMNALGIAAALHGAKAEPNCAESAHSPKDSPAKPCSSHRADDCGLCQLLASTTGKIHLTDTAPDEGVDSGLACLVAGNSPHIHHRISLFHSRGPPNRD